MGSAQRQRRVVINLSIFNPTKLHGRTVPPGWCDEIKKFVSVVLLLDELSVGYEPCLLGHGIGLVEYHRVRRKARLSRATRLLDVDRDEYNSPVGG